jgi:hypothetical protein
MFFVMQVSIYASSSETTPSRVVYSGGTYHTITETLSPMTTTIYNTLNGSSLAGYLFLSDEQLNNKCKQNNFLRILDASGHLVYYKKDNDKCQSQPVVDFKPQEDGSLTYWSGSRQKFIRMNNRYSEISEENVTGYPYADLHDLIVTKDGHRVFIIYYSKVVPNIAGIYPNGQPTLTATENAVQEQDKDGVVLMNWNTEGRYSITDTLDSALFTAKEPVDHLHLNSVSIDPLDGNIIASARNTDAIVKIDRKTGQTIWQAGGKRNQFKISSLFSHQHDVHRLENGNLTLFDNGNNRNPPSSRFVEYALDENAKTLTLVREIRMQPYDVFSFATGSGRRQPNGNTLIGWGFYNDPAITEHDAAGNLVMALDMRPKSSYRAIRSEWHGYPDYPPIATIVSGTLYFSWNGSTETDHYAIIADGVPQGTVKKSDFEDSYPVAPFACTWKVIPMDVNGTELSSVEVTNPSCPAKTSYLPMIFSKGSQKDH